jgi:hypothetical protein
MMFPPTTWNEEEILRLIDIGQEEFLELDSNVMGLSTTTSRVKRK